MDIYSVTLRVLMKKILKLHFNSILSYETFQNRGERNILSLHRSQRLLKLT